jgi:D-glycero-alpha-D-manno-heptose-7-phosphate kinase
MIITRTPFRVSLGGGGTDLPAYYSKYGGFVFSFGLDKYMYIQLTQPVVDDLVRIKYSESETVENTSMVKHALAREILKRLEIKDAITVVSVADIPAGTGLASSAAYGVGLLKAGRLARGEARSPAELAEEAIDIEMNVLKKPVGKQDQYMVALGGLTVMEIAQSGKVVTRPARVSADVADELESNLMLFFTGVSRGAEAILQEQSNSINQQQSQVVDSMHFIKELGYSILESVESGNIDQVGILMDKHWQYKKRIAQGMTNPQFDKIYTAAREAGALGGKIAGAGGGGFFVFYVPQNRRAFKKKMAEFGLRQLSYRFDYEGTKVLLDIRNIVRPSMNDNGKYTNAQNWVTSSAFPS